VPRRHLGAPADYQEWNPALAVALMPQATRSRNFLHLLSLTILAARRLAALIDPRKASVAATLTEAAIAAMLTEWVSI
jgi:hypothetical protein